VKGKIDRRVAVSIVAALLLAPCLAGCATQAIEPPEPVAREAPINSLALEQCLKVNGPEKCAG
jgi:hypothetical protein